MTVNRMVSANRGFSLVELLVSMAIALIVMAGVLNSFLASRNAFKFNQELSFIQDNARYATAYLTRQIRMAGYFGCDMSVNTTVVNSIDGSNFNDMLSMEGIEGWNSARTDAGTPTLFKSEVKGITDAVIVRYADQDNAMTVVGHDINSAVIDLAEPHGYDPDTVMIIADTDCTNIGVFANSGPTNNNDNATTIVHNKGNSTTENCSKAIKGRGVGTPDLNGDGVLDCSDGCTTNSCDWSDTTNGYSDGAQLMAFKSTAFYVKDSALDASMPVLAIRRLTDGGAVSATAEELVPGIEDFQLKFGTDSNADGIPDHYYNANNVPTWEDVITVRIEMLVRSENIVLPQAESRDFTLGGNATVTYNDRYLRQLVTTTVRIRNR